MLDCSLLLKSLKASAHSPVRNYAIPGLTSWLVSSGGPGLVRLFHSERRHVEPITPHTHRFNFSALVLQGGVTNRVWTVWPYETGFVENTDEYVQTKLEYKSEIGAYAKGSKKVVLASFEDYKYTEGDTYSMDAFDFHSIYFERDTWVLMLEEPSSTAASFVLEPFVDGQSIPAFNVEDWMFKKESNA
jgi:hypothetical protein